MSTIGIIGAGAIGSAFARALAGKGLKAIIANSRGPESLAELARELGPSITPGTREQAAAQDIVLVAVNWSKLPAALAGLPDFGGRIVIDANNPIEAPLFEPAGPVGRVLPHEEGQRPSGEPLYPGAPTPPRFSPGGPGRPDGWGEGRGDEIGRAHV